MGQLLLPAVLQGFFFGGTETLELRKRFHQMLASCVQQQLQGMIGLNKSGFEFSKPENISHGLMRLQFNVKMQVKKLTFSTGRRALARALSCGCSSGWEGKTW